MHGVWKKGPGKDLFDVLDKVDMTPQQRVEHCSSFASQAQRCILKIPPQGLIHSAGFLMEVEQLHVSTQLNVIN